jgi:hypothetical protein
MEFLQALFVGGEVNLATVDKKGWEFFLYFRAKNTYLYIFARG